MTARQEIARLGLACALGIASPAVAQTAVFWPGADLDSRTYPFVPGGQRSDAIEAVFGQYDIPEFLGAFDNRDSQLQIAFDTEAQCVPIGLALEDYDVLSVTVTMTVGATVGAPAYDPTYDDVSTYPIVGVTPAPDPDPGRPFTLFGAGFRNGYTGFEIGPNPVAGPPGFGESGEGYANMGFGQNIRHVYAIDFDDNGSPRDVSSNLDDVGSGANAFNVNPFAIGTTDDVAVGATLVAGTTLTFEVDLSDPDILQYVREGLRDGVLGFVLATLHPATGGPGGGGGGDYALMALTENGSDVPTMRIEYNVPGETCVGDITCDGTTDVFDFAQLASSFGTVGSRSDGDVNGDGLIDVFDFGDLAADFGCQE